MLVLVLVLLLLLVLDPACSCLSVETLLHFQPAGTVNVADDLNAPPTLIKDLVDSTVRSF